MSLSAGAIIEKNKIATDSAWLILMTITMPDTTVIRITNNSENVTWPTVSGDTYTSFPFELDEIGNSSKNEVPSISVRVSNVTRALEPYLDSSGGMVDSSVDLYIVNSINVITPTKLTGTYNASAEVDENFDIVSASSGSQWVEFTLGASNPFNKRFPRNKIYRNVCRYRVFQGSRCQYSGPESECNRAIDTCKNTYSNSINFGGCPGAGTKAVYV